MYIVHILYVVPANQHPKHIHDLLFFFVLGTNYPKKGQTVKVHYTGNTLLLSLILSSLTEYIWEEQKQKVSKKI